MGYAQRLIGRILADERARGNRLADQKVYRDEPILRTGADLLKDRTRNGASAEHSSKLSSGEMLATSFFRGHPARAGQTSPRTASTTHRRGDRVASYAWEQRTTSVNDAYESSPSVELPPLLQELRALERKAAELILAENQLFVEQALLAASYEDDYEFHGTVQRYFPTYRGLTDQQLRGYFAWRTKARKGNLEKTSLSFAFLHLYELANSIGPEGTTSSEQGLRNLEGFYRAYAKLDERIERYAREWCRDYAIYHGLHKDAERLFYEASGKAGRTHDEALAVLQDFEEQATREGEAPANSLISDARLFDALAALSSYRIDQSRMLREDEEALRSITCGMWRSLSAYYRTQRKHSLFESLFGMRAAMPHAMFRSAVFLPQGKHPDTVMEIGPVTHFICANGRWRCERLYHVTDRSRKLGALLKAADDRLRERLGVETRLKDVSAPKYVMRIIDKQIDAAMEKRQAKAEAKERARLEAERRNVSIDFSKLSGIRAEAALSCEALLVDEERAEAGPTPTAAHIEAIEIDEIQVGPSTSPHAEEAPFLSEAEPENDQHSPVAPTSPFSPAETAYLRCLLSGAEAAKRKAALADAGISEPMMMDALNEKALDEIGDVILEEGETGPEILEDYLEDVRRIVEA